jgi:hypothetical protein
MTGYFKILSIFQFILILSHQCIFVSCCRAIAASAPIFQFSGLTPCEAFSRIVTTDYNSVSTECRASIRKSWAVINNITSYGNFIRRLKNNFPKSVFYSFTVPSNKGGYENILVLGPKQLPTHWIGRWICPRAILAMVINGTNSLPCQDLNSSHRAHSQYPTDTAL